jgi:hypothetical protein
MKAAGFGPGIRNYVFSRQPRESSEPEFEFVSKPIKPFAQRLRVPGRSGAPERSRSWVIAGPNSTLEKPMIRVGLD